MKAPPILAAALFSLLWAEGLSQEIRGRVHNEEQHALEMVSVALLHRADSTVAAYTQTDEEGRFSLRDIPAGAFYLQLHLLGFDPWQQDIAYEGGLLDLGAIGLRANTALEEVVVTLVTPIALKKDTVSYHAGAFRVQEGATVEDLLKKLPGIEVDQAGKVTAQGEPVTKIYLDGKEFFTGDPAIATKNLSASIIKTVEVIDEKSDKERLTGIRDKEPEKVINLELEEESRVNDFGKLQGGYGTEDRYLSGINYNRFSDRLQLSLLGKYNNINQTGSSLSDMTDLFKVNGMGSSDLPGFLTSGLGGLNAGMEWQKGKIAQADYLYNHTEASSGKTVIRRTEYIGEESINSVSKSESENTAQDQQLNFQFRDRSRKLSSFNLLGYLGKVVQEGSGISGLEKFNTEGVLDLESGSVTRHDNENSRGDLSLQYTLRFNEKSTRNLSLYAKADAFERKSKSRNDQINRYQVSEPDLTEEITENVQREQKNSGRNGSVQINYTEPIAKNHFLEFRGNWKRSEQTENVDQAKYVDGTLEVPLLYELEYRQDDLTGGLFYQLDQEKLTLYAGGELSAQSQRFGLQDAENLENKFTNFLPSLRLDYRPKPGRTFKLHAGKTIRLPSMQELNPVVNDFNSLFIYQGNPELQPESHYAGSAIFVRHDLSKKYHVLARLNYRYTDNSIVRTEVTDTTGVRSSGFVNLGDQNQVGLHLNFSKRLLKQNIRFHAVLRANYSEYLSLINEIPNETRTTNGIFNLSVENETKEKIDWMLGGNWTKNYTSFTSGNNADRSYFKQSYFLILDWTLSRRISLLSQFKYDVYTDTNFGSDQRVPVWNASLSYTMLKNKNLRIQLTAFDLLNQNVGITRTSSDNYFEEMQQEVLGNYYMLHLTYDFKAF